MRSFAPRIREYDRAESSSVPAAMNCRRDTVSISAAPLLMGRGEPLHGLHDSRLTASAGCPDVQRRTRGTRRAFLANRLSGFLRAARRESKAQSRTHP